MVVSHHSTVVCASLNSHWSWCKYVALCTVANYVQLIADIGAS